MRTIEKLSGLLILVGGVLFFATSASAQEVTRVHS